MQVRLLVVCEHSVEIGRLVPSFPSIGATSRHESLIDRSPDHGSWHRVTVDNLKVGPSGLRSFRADRLLDGVHGGSLEEAFQFSFRSQLP